MKQLEQLSRLFWLSHSEKFKYSAWPIVKFSLNFSAGRIKVGTHSWYIKKKKFILLLEKNPPHWHEEKHENSHLTLKLPRRKKNWRAIRHLKVHLPYRVTVCLWIGVGEKLSECEDHWKHILHLLFRSFLLHSYLSHSLSCYVLIPRGGHGRSLSAEKVTYWLSEIRKLIYHFSFFSSHNFPTALSQPWTVKKLKCIPWGICFTPKRSPEMIRKCESELVFCPILDTRLKIYVYFEIIGLFYI